MFISQQPEFSNVVITVTKETRKYKILFEWQQDHEGIRKYISIDGGMADNIRPALYNAKYACDVANKMEKEKTHTYEIAGKCCESGDIIMPMIGTIGNPFLVGEYSDFAINKAFNSFFHST